MYTHHYIPYLKTTPEDTLFLSISLTISVGGKLKEKNAKEQ
jgi:hypothetical protein